MTERANQSDRRRSPRRDRGVTFIELLVSIVLIGTLGVAVLAALGAAIRGSTLHRDAALGQAWLATIGDALTEVDPDPSDGDDLYLDCVTEPDVALLAQHYETTIVDPLLAGSPGAPDVDIVQIEFLDPNGNLDPLDDSFDTACHYGDGGRTQRLTIEARLNGNTRRLSVVKRPASDPTANLGSPPPTAGGGNVTPVPTPGW